MKKHCGGIKELSYRARQPEEQIEYEKIANALQTAIEVLGRIDVDKIETLLTYCGIAGRPAIAKAIVSGLTGKE